MDLPNLSMRQRQVLRLLALGRIDKEVAAELGITVATVRVYRKRLTVALGVRGLGPALLVAHRLKLIDIEALADEAMAQRRIVGPASETGPEG